MKFTSEERQSYSKLLKEPISFWVLTFCFIGSYVIYSALKNYAGWTWLGDLQMELPWVILLVLAFSRHRLTPKEKELLHKIANEHPDLTSGVEGEQLREGL